MIALIDYGMGNLCNVYRALESVGGNVEIIEKGVELDRFDALILPGVGNFGDGMEHLNSRGFTPEILKAVNAGKPFLGICLGMQMLMESSEEAPGMQGLGIFKGKVLRFPDGGEKVPHMGWNSIRVEKSCPCLNGIADDSYFYFVRSYYVMPYDPAVTAASCEYMLKFTAALTRDNVFATQFHPEKSQDKGIQILKNFVGQLNQPGGRMNKAVRKKMLIKTYESLFSVFGQQHCTLDYKAPHELMIATIMSAQCTDVRVNKVTAELFVKYPDVEAFASARLEELEDAIKSVGFYHNKAKHIINACRDVLERFGGKVPKSMDKLTSLDGIGRKTANVILGDAFDIPGFPVDTHVKRVLRRLGLVSSDDPVRIEREVTALVPDKLWVNFSHIIILHGRTVCLARKPRCEECVLSSDCEYYKNKK